MGNKRVHTLLKNESGQTTVEYILLLAVVITFMTTIWNSKALKNFIGEDSDFFNALAQGIRVNYQFAATVTPDTETPDAPVLNHPSYYNAGQSRFFTFNGSIGYPSGTP